MFVSQIERDSLNLFTRVRERLVREGVNSAEARDMAWQLVVSAFKEAAK